MAASFICYEDFEEEAKKRLNPMVWNFYSLGAGSKCTLKDNIQAYTRYRIYPRVLRDVSEVDLSTSVLGSKISFPVGVSPTAFHYLAHHDKELATAKACQRMDTCMIVSCWASTSPVEIDTHCNHGGLRWFQTQSLTYEVTETFVRRAEGAGYKALVVTVDQATVKGKKVNSYLPPTVVMGNFPHTSKLKDTDCYFKPDCDWTYIDWLRSITTLPIVLKGILRPDDAREALKHNIQGILVSNHGGRQLDHLPATIDALPGIVHAVEGSGVEVYIDGGIRHGTDVLKALALGARAVFIGRPVVYGLACNGEEGVYQVLNILKDEVQQAFTLSGCRNINEVQSTDGLVVHESAVHQIKSRL